MIRTDLIRMPALLPTAPELLSPPTTAGAREDTYVMHVLHRGIRNHSS